MPKRIFCLLVLLTPPFAFAQQPVPTGIVPIIGEITLRLTPKHEARCTRKTHEKKPGEFFGTSSTLMGTQEIYEESPGVLKSSIVVGDALNYFRITMDVKADGSGYLPTEPELKTNSKLEANDKEQLDAFKQMMKRIAEAGGFAIGMPLRQGSRVSMGDFCKILPGALGTENRSGGYSVLGMTTVRGRETIILSGEEAVSCSLPGTSLNFQMKGWWAVDRQSGLTAGSSTTTVLSVAAQSGRISGTEDDECAITGAPTKAAQAPSPAAPKPSLNEQRLLELKSLLDKGLISKEQYEQKSTEILKTM